MTFFSLSFFGFVEIQAIILNALLNRGLSVSGTMIWIINRILEVLLYPSLVIGLWFLHLSMEALADEIRHCAD